MTFVAASKLPVTRFSFWARIAALFMVAACASPMSDKDWGNLQDTWRQINADTVEEGKPISLKGYVNTRFGYIVMTTIPPNDRDILMGQCIGIIPDKERGPFTSGFYEIEGEFRTMAFPSRSHSKNVPTINGGPLPFCLPWGSFIVAKQVRRI